MTKPAAIVTRESLKAMLQDPRPHYVETVIGRALLVLLANQTADEQETKATRHHNGAGFGAFDAEYGTVCAKYYQQYHKLMPWMVRMWVKPDRHGVPRIAKYARQLDLAAQAKAPQAA